MEGEEALEKMHELLLGALRSRELEIFKYLTILGPALAGFGWLFYQDSALAYQTPPRAIGPGLFIAVTVSVVLLLLLGAVYSLTLGCNYRYITLELAKLESQLSIKRAMLRQWPKSPEMFVEKYSALCFPWCTPPAVIQVFWYAFLRSRE